MAASGPGVITTVAGNGIPGYTGDRGPATGAELDVSKGVAVDATGNLYIAGINRVRKIDHNGTITTVVGNLGVQGIAVDAAGNLYIANRNRIRKVDHNGTITTVAGNDNPGWTSGDGGPATSAELCDPQGVALDVYGNLYIADTFNCCIRKVDTSGVITTVYSLGKPDSGFGLPGSIEMAVDAAGNLYVVAGHPFRIDKITKDGVVTTVAGNGNGGDSGDGGPAVSAGLDDPYSMVVDPRGDLYFIDGGNRIRRVDAGGTITTVAGDNNPGYFGDGGPAASAELAAASTSIYSSSYLAVDATGNLYIADTGNNRIRRVTAPIPPAPVGQKIIQFKLGRYYYLVAGSPFGIYGRPAYISHGRALVPVRYLADALGAQTTWDAAANKVTISRGSDSVVLFIGSSVIATNGTSSLMDVTARIQDGRTYVPARYIAEAFGCSVAWNADDQTIIVTPRSS
jgi:sugar lactone lactonase YvrE